MKRTIDASKYLVSQSRKQIIESHINSFGSPLVDCRFADNPCSCVIVGFDCDVCETPKTFICASPKPVSIDCPYRNVNRFVLCETSTFVILQSRYR